MTYLLDTNILSARLRRPSGLQHRFVQYGGRLYTSSVALAELYDWVFRRRDPAATLAAVEKMLHYEVATIDFDNDCRPAVAHAPAEHDRLVCPVPFFAGRAIE